MLGCFLLSPFASWRLGVESNPWPSVPTCRAIPKRWLKQRLAAAITKDVMEIFNYGEESISVAMEEIKSQDWASKVYKSEILGYLKKLYMKPGYTM
jgi:4-oxalocrotonate tautomerase